MERRKFIKNSTGLLGCLAAGSLLQQGLSDITGISIFTRESLAKTTPGRETNYYGVELSTQKPEIKGLWLDSLGNGRKWPGALTLDILEQKYTTDKKEGWINYYPEGRKDAKTSFKFNDKSFLIRSEAKNNDAIEPFVMYFYLKGPHPMFATLLGRMENEGEVRLPAVMHIPGQGTVKISATSGKNTPLSLGYEGTRYLITDEKGNHQHVKITFPAANEDNQWIEYKLEVIEAYPETPGIEGDKRFDGFRRCWLNIMQMSAENRMLANNVASDVCSFVYHEYSEIAALTGELAEGVSGVNILRDSLNRFLDDGRLGYGMAHYRGEPHYPEAALDTWPSLLIAAFNYYQASKDDKWLQRQIDKLIEWGNNSLILDKNGNGLIEFHQSGNRGDCYYRPANWWDAINFGHEDAYSNALAYKGFRGLALMAKNTGRIEEWRKFDEAAIKLKSSYYKTFYNPETGLLAGWKSRDGELHDYAFTFIQGMAIGLGLVDDEAKANGLLDALVAKMKEVGYTRFDLGIPGNLVAIPPEDYYQGFKKPRWDKTRHPFQTYENGGASANHSYYLISSFYKLGRIEEGDMILLPMLKGFNECSFQGFDGPWTSYDWRTWKGEPKGYEGMLVDNYLAVKAVLVRQGMIEPEWGYWK
jgi:hypothetical protein